MDLVELTQKGKKHTNYRHPWESVRLRFIKNKLKHILPDVTLPYIFLDIGSGDTFLAKQLSETYKNSQFHCVDIAFTDEQLKTFNLESGINIAVYKSTNDLPLQSKDEIDVVLLLDVLEHIEADEAFLKSLNKLPNFSKKTNLLITVPAFQSLFTQHDIILGHYRRYTNNSLTKVLEHNQFLVEKKGYFFTSLLLPRFIEKQIESLKKNPSKETRVSSWSHGKLITNLFSSILICDNIVTNFLENLGVRIIGLSNYAICKKKH